MQFCQFVERVTWISSRGKVQSEEISFKLKKEIDLIMDLSVAVVVLWKVKQWENVNKCGYCNVKLWKIIE